MNTGQQGMFACAVAERLMQRHEAFGIKDRRPFTVALRPLLDACWDAACGDRTQFSEIKQILGEFYLSEFCHNDGQDGPDDADEPAAAAVLFAAEFAMHGCVDFALWAGRRGEEAADISGSDAGEDCDEDDPVVAELVRQLQDLDLIAQFADDLQYVRTGRDAGTVRRLRTEVKAVLAQRL